MSDADLVEACRRGDREAFAALIERHARMVAAVAFASAGDAALVDDVVQDTFVAAWQRLGSLRDAAAVRPWLRRIAANLARKARRARVRETAERDITGDATPFDDAVARQRAQLIETALARLAPSYREPLVLFYYEQQSVKQVASALRLGEATVMQRLSRARRQLGEALDADLRSDLSRRGAAPMAGVAAAVLVMIGGSHGAAAATAVSRAAAPMKLVRLAAALGAVAGVAWLASRAVSTSHAEHAGSPPTVRHERTQLPSSPPALPPNTAPAEAPAIPPPSEGSGDSEGSGMKWASRLMRGMAVAVDDPVETCRRGTMGLAVATLEGPNWSPERVPDDRIMNRAYEIAEKSAQSCAGAGSWPTLWAVCEASPIDILDGNVNCYPYDVFD